MHKKSVITILIGLMLLLVGGSALWWIVTERQKEQQEVDAFRLKYSSETNEYIQQYEKWLLLPPEERTELLLGLDSNGSTKTQDQLQQEQQERLKADMDKLAAGEMTVYPFADDFYGENWQEQLEEHKKRKEFSEFVLTGSIMSTLVGGLIVCWFILLNIARFFIWICVGFKRFFVRKRKFPDPTPSEADTKESEQEKPQEEEQQNQFGDISKVLLNSGWQQPEFIRGRSKIRRQKSSVSIHSESCLKNTDQDGDHSIEQPTVQKDEKTPEVKSNKETIHSKEKHKTEKILTVGPEQANPIDNTLKDLTQQVSAIREYAAHQQNRLEKLQDGYDWNIIKNFCLRIIRCIDNIECRITQLIEQECEVTDLEEVRDELIFALESSGVEQFEPEINSEYRGQEKFAEAVKEKKHCNNPEQKGTIEKVLRPGFQCFIDEENVRIVRPAQVRLYA